MQRCLNRFGGRTAETDQPKASRAPRFDP